MTTHRRSAPSRRNPAVGSSSSSPAAFLPAPVCACLQRLPAAAERLLSVQDGSSDRAQKTAETLNEQLKPLIQYLAGKAECPGFDNIPGSSKSGAVLADSAVRQALLRLVSAAARLPPEQPANGTPDSAGASNAVEAAVRSVGANGTVQTAVRSAYGAAVLTVAMLLQCSVLMGELKPTVVEFACKLLRMQTLQAFSRQSAAAAAAFPGPGAAAIHASRLFAFTTGLALVAKSQAAPGHLPEVCTELVSALHDSCVLKHGARLLLAAGQAATGPQRNPKALMDGIRCFSLTFRGLYDLFSDIRQSAATSTELSTAAQLRKMLSGRCVQYAAVVLGLAAMCEADGGPSYGLPRELLPRMPIRLCGGESRNAVGPIFEGCLFASAIFALDPSIRAPPPGRRAALALLMRMGRLAVASGQAWAEADPTPAKPASPATIKPAAAALRAVIEREGLAKVAVQALMSARRNLRPLQPGAAAGLVEEVVEWWRLLGAVARHVVPLGMPAVVIQWFAYQVAAMEESAVHRTEDGGLHLPPEPPPDVAAALAGGLLPCLERLLRRAGEQPSGPEAALMCEVLTQTTCLLPLLLVYGEERQAAALVVTIGKMLRVADPRVYLENVNNVGDTFTDTPVCTLYAALECLGTWSYTLQAAGVTAEGTPAAAATSAPLRQLVLLMSCALCEWLPPLARLARGVLELTAQRGEPGGAIEGSVLTDLTPLQMIMPWLHHLFCMRGEEEGVPTAHSEAGEDAGCSSSGTAPLIRNDMGPMGDIADPGGWRHLLLAEMDVVPLLGLALRRAAADPPQYRLNLALGCCAAAVAFPEQVRKAVLAAAADPEAGWRPERLRALVSGLRAAAVGSGGGSGGPGEQEAGAAQTQGSSGGAGEDTYTDLADVLAAQLESWCAAGDSSGEGRSEVGYLTQLQPAVRDAVWPMILTLETSLVSPAELRRRQLLRTCGNPACVNLAGGSETKLGLKACGRCGAVRYCCRECQTAHWKAGHKEACGSGRGG